jgi:LPPG:FO 2-phospho-L-lactate transferase
VLIRIHPDRLHPLPGAISVHCDLRPAERLVSPTGRRAPVAELIRGRLLDSTPVKTTALAGGVGGAKLLVGLDRALTPGGLTAIVNTGDDETIYGVEVSPDLDIVTYWLAGLADTDRGWGLRGDTFAVVDSLRALGEATWFQLGDRDFATCLYRTQRLRDGASLSAVTDDIRTSLGIQTIVLPATDDRIRTKIHTDDGRTLDFQEYFVKERQKATVTNVTIAGIADAKPSPSVVAAIETADTVVICPSNPVLSIGPIVGLAGVRETLRNHPRVVAVTPIVRNVALKGPAAKIMATMGLGKGAAAVARMYADFVDLFIVDETDTEQMEIIENLGLRVASMDTIMGDEQASERLARSILEVV